MNTKDQEKAAQWIAETVPCLPQNVGELTALLSAYHSEMRKDELPTEEEIHVLVNKFLIIDHDNLSDSDVPYFTLEGAKAITNLLKEE